MVLVPTVCGIGLECSVFPSNFGFRLSSEYFVKSKFRVDDQGTACVQKATFSPRKEVIPGRPFLHLLCQEGRRKVSNLILENFDFDRNDRF